MLTERLCVLVSEPDGNCRPQIHDALTDFAIRQDTEVTVHWIKPEAENASVEAVLEEADLALLAADAAESTALGTLLSEKNPACEIVFFGDARRQPDAVSYLSRLFPTRPIAYLERPDRDAFRKAAEDCAQRRALSRCFLWQNRQTQYRIPFSHILYLRSDRNYFYVHLRGGTEHRLLGKLDAAERLLPKNSFLRIHQSYLVNRAEIRQIDKTKRSVLLSSGEELYISKARYEQTIIATKDGEENVLY